MARGLSRTGTSGLLCRPIVRSNIALMKRIAAAPLWFLVGWFMGSAVAWAFGLSALLAPIVALALAGIVVADPRGVIWNQAPVQKAPMARRIGTAKAHTS